MTAPHHWPLCLITGANSGIGLATAKALRTRGFDLILVCRDAERGSTARDEILGIASDGEHSVDLVLGDLSDQNAIHAIKEQVVALAGARALDVLVNNAGALFERHQLSAQGYEMTWALNHLGYFLLTDCLLDLLRASDQARIINVSSEAHRRGIIRFDDIRYKRQFGGFQAYCDSKLANLLFTRELARRLSHTHITVNAMHPGSVGSNFGAQGGRLARTVMTLARPFSRTPEQGAKTIISLATDPSLIHTTGLYFVNEKPKKPARLALNDEVAKRLWYISEEMTDTI